MVQIAVRSIYFKYSKRFCLCLPWIGNIGPRIKIYCSTHSSLTRPACIQTLKSIFSLLPPAVVILDIQSKYLPWFGLSMESIEWLEKSFFRDSFHAVVVFVVANEWFLFNSYEEVLLFYSPRVFYLHTCLRPSPFFYFSFCYFLFFFLPLSRRFKCNRGIRNLPEGQPTVYSLRLHWTLEYHCELWISV